MLNKILRKPGLSKFLVKTVEMVDVWIKLSLRPIHKYFGYIETMVIYIYKKKYSVQNNPVNKEKISAASWIGTRIAIFF